MTRYIFLALIVVCALLSTATVSTVHAQVSCPNKNCTIAAYLTSLNGEIDSLTCAQYQIQTVLSVLAENSTIYKTRSKQLQKISGAIQQLIYEREAIQQSGLANSNTSSSAVVNNSQPTYISLNGQAFMYQDGKCARSCKEYKNPSLPYHYNNQGSGVYAIEPTPGLVMNVYCDMETEGGGWTLVSGTRSNYFGIHFHTFEDSTAIASSNTNSFHIKTLALLDISSQVRAASDSSSSPITTLYQSNWPFSAACNLTSALRNAIKNTPSSLNGDLPASCTILSGLTSVPTHYTYGKTYNGHSTGFRMGFPHGYSGHMNQQSYTTFSFISAPEGFIVGDYSGIYYSFNTEQSRNGAVFLR